MSKVARIVADVRRRGNPAVLDWTRRLDHRNVSAGTLEVSRREIERAWNVTPREVRRAIAHAARNIERVAELQRLRPFKVEVEPGVFVEQRVEPLQRVGCYVPGGRFPLPSTLLMTVVPAVVAGVRDVAVTCPRPTDAVLCAALEAGATRVLRIGGAQAIAALAYGTATIPRVDKIVGPGNVWVAAAKRMVSSDCAIDFDAGPSEVIICSDNGRPAWIAADLLAQAEHDPKARSILITTNARLARSTALELRRQTSGAVPRNVTITRVRSAAAATNLVNRIAPEHLVCDRRRDVGRFTAAGTIYVGPWSAPAAGDYATGSNHVLPTGGAARFRGGLTTADFVRTFTVQTLTKRGLRRLAPSAETLAAAEGLVAHRQSLEIRS